MEHQYSLEDLTQAKEQLEKKASDLYSDIRNIKRSDENIMNLDYLLGSGKDNINRIVLQVYPKKAADGVEDFEFGPKYAEEILSAIRDIYKKIREEAFKHAISEYMG